MPITSAPDYRRRFGFVPAEIRADVGAFVAANLAGDSGSKMGQPDVIRPAADSGPMAAPTIREIDQPTPNASGAHLSEGNLFAAGSFGHAPLKRAQAKSSSSGSSSHKEHLRCGDGRFGGRGLSVPALTFRVSTNFALANCLASRSFENVSVIPGSMLSFFPRRFN
jgi:hypothetical protein